MSSGAAVIGVGAHRFGRFSATLVELGMHAASDALTDAGITWSDVQAVTAGSSQFAGGFGWSLSGNEVIQAMGESGIPVANLSAACAAGGSAISSAVSLVEAGRADLVLAIGAEKMPSGFIARPPGAPDDSTDVEYLRWVTLGATNSVYWALEARRRMHEYGTTENDLATVASKAHEVGRHNPRARYARPFSVDEVLNSAPVSEPLRLYEVCAVSDGAAAAIICSAAAVSRFTSKPVWVRASETGTGLFGDPTIRIPELSATPASGTPAMSECASTAARAFAAAGVGPDDVDFLEVQDNSVWQELAVPELLGFCEPGESDQLVRAGETLPVGRVPVNPSGGFLSFGEATTAMGIWQVCESVWQLRGEAGPRQVPNARLGMCQLLGLQGNGAITILGL